MEKARMQTATILELEGLVELWDDQKLRAGEDFLSRLYQELRQTNIAVLLVSNSFLTSDFIRDVEVRTVFEQCEKEGGTVIYPLLTRPCPYQEVAWLAKMQMRPAGPRLRALSTFRGAKLEEVTTAVAREIAAIARAGKSPA
jgi:TIR domain-containing protein